MSKTILTAVVALALIGASFSSAQAQEAPGSEPEQNRVAVTISPVHLLFPVFEAMAEVRAHPKMSVAAIAGAGSVDEIGVFEVGGQFNYYALGSFDHGLQVGVEAIYIGASTSSDGQTASGEGVSTGAYVGYKYAMRLGLTVNAQLGVQYYAIRAASSTSSAEEDDIAPLLNLNVGWSF